MEAVFLKLLNMSITASWLVLAVVVLRFVLKKSPKVLFCVLWALVGLRLVCPFSLESVLSLIPSAEPVPTNIVYSQSPAPTTSYNPPVTNNTMNPIIFENPTPSVADSMTVAEIITLVASIVWLVGIAAMMLYTVISFMRLRKKVGESVLLKDNIYICDRIPSPFILGIFRPKIYLPSSMNEEDMEYVIAHEKAHIKRGDHIHKPLGFALLSVYWFNPVLWVAYILLCRDIEFACDEKVIKNMGAEIKKPYSTALINCSVNRRMISACPLAFGEVGVKGRIKSVLNYKKPAFWIICVALIASIVVSACFLTNPKTKTEDITQLKNGSDLKGVSINIVKADFSSIDPYIEIEWKNDTDKDITYGEEFYIKRKGKDCRVGDYSWADIGHMVKAGDKSTKRYIVNDMTMPKTGKYCFETYFSIYGKERYTAWVNFSVTDPEKLLSAFVLEPVEITYSEPSRSFIPKIEDKSTLRITKDLVLVNESGIPDPSVFGLLNEISLNKENFDASFDSKFDETMLEIKSNNKRAWEIKNEGDRDWYLLLEQKDGSFYFVDGDNTGDTVFADTMVRYKKQPYENSDNVVIEYMGDEIYTEGSSTYSYWLRGGEVTITHCSNFIGGEQIIPAYIENYPVTSIWQYAFADCTQITEVTIPDTVTEISSGAFLGCFNLEKINLPSNFIDIDNTAFVDTAFYNNPDNWKEGALYLGEYLIDTNDEMPTTFRIKDGTKIIANGAFSNQLHLKSVIFNDTLENVSSFAFENCQFLKSITIPSSTVSIDDLAFAYCNNIEEIIIRDGNVDFSWNSIEDTKLYKNKANWENGALYVGSYLVKANKKVDENFEVKKGTTTICSFAFEENSKIKSVKLPDSVTKINNSAFYFCKNLKSINIPKNALLKDAFLGNGNLENIDVHEKNKYLCDEDGVLYSKDKKILLCYPACYTKETYEVPDSVETISSYAFNYCKYLKKVVLPDSVKSIGDSVFVDCKKLSEVILTNNITTISDSMFYGCESLKTIKIPDTVTKIDGYAFFSCKSLEKITLPQGLKEIGWTSFFDCQCLKTIIIPDSVTTIENGAFGLCKGLEEVTIPDSVKEISDEAFEGSPNIKTVRFGSEAQKEKFKDLFGKKVNLIVE